MKYKLDGFAYNPSSKDTKWILSGKLELEPNNSGSFEAKIMNAASNFPNQTIKGRFCSDESSGLTRLIFTESPLGQNMQSRSYLLRKEGSKELEGTYKGRWSAGPITDKAEINISRA